MDITKASFEDYDIRRVYDEQTETWYFSVVDIVRALMRAFGDALENQVTLSKYKTG